MDDQFAALDLTTNFTFLNHREVQAHFADLNIALLSGRHIQTGEGYLFTLVNSYPEEFRYFYRALYGLELRQARAENIDYFYLDFPDEGKGRLNTSDRFREMTAWETLFALMLLNMYYDRFFEKTKVITWPVLRREIEEGDLAHLYRKAFFNSTVRENLSDQEVKTLSEILKKVLRNFARWGWVKLLPPEEADGELAFEIRESIDRLGKLYNYEISDFDQFINQIDLKRTKS